ncbi:MAG: hypothetical protein F4X92_09165 [Gammaproteobacteria bacterium]|nr:hypothetical protein [Gammaproteobacteria bacterium]
MHQKNALVLAAAIATLSLIGCGGGGTGGGNGMIQQPGSMDPPANESPGTSELARLAGQPIQESNSDLAWYASPQIDLPVSGLDGLQVTRPNIGGGALPRIQFDRDLSYILEPSLRYADDSGARTRLETVSFLIWKMTNLAYTQWTRHLNYHPGELFLIVGDGPDDSLTRHDTDTIAVAYFDGNSIVLTTEWITHNYRLLSTGNDTLTLQATQELFFVISHESGHQFGYTNSGGNTEGCGDSPVPCHAPAGSGSLMSYDHLEGRSVRYNVTEEDVRHIPNAAWNDSNVDRYEVAKTGESMFIDSWGVWIDHEFEVSGQTAPGRIHGGNLNIVDNITGTGWVNGRASTGVVLTGNATWSGQDNFLGVDLTPRFLGALLRADANLRYTFSSGNLNLRVNNFEAHYQDGSGSAKWHEHDFPDDDFGDFSYDMRCNSVKCSSNVVNTNWYASDEGDPTGYVGGVVHDAANRYAGSFVAQKD